MSFNVSSAQLLLSLDIELRAAISAVPRGLPLPPRIPQVPELHPDVSILARPCAEDPWIRLYASEISCRQRLRLVACYLLDEVLEVPEVHALKHAMANRPQKVEREHRLRPAASRYATPLVLSS